MADVLIIDDDQLICEILSKMMEQIGHEGQCAVTGEDGLEMARNGNFDVVFLDVNLPDANGLDLIRPIKATPSSPEIIIITGDTDPDGAEMAINHGAWNYLEKPFLRQELNLQVSRVLQFRKEKGRISTPGALKRNHIIGDSEAIKSCLDQVSIAAYSDTNVLISGEQGTGKQLFAKTIHLNSDRGQNDFVVLDCSAVNETIAEGLLFGHKKGAFFGALASRTGLIQRAHNGTLFVDEISEFPYPLQKALLRVMETCSFTPVGGQKEKDSNFRVIATTNRDLDELSEQGRFRKDLLFRLKGTHIHLPPLREIRDDMIKIAIFYIGEMCRKYKVDTKGVSPEFMDIINAYEWPGNVRELVNAIDRAVATAKSEPTLYSIHLPSYIKAKVIKETFSANPGQNKMPLDDFLRGDFPKLSTLIEQTEKTYLENLLKYTERDIKKACDISGISKSRMYARIKKYDLSG